MKKEDKLDLMDKQLLNIVLNDSKTSLRNIAKKLKTSFVTIRNRLKKFEEEEIIKKYSAIIDYEKLGYDIHMLINIRISKGKLFELEKKIAKNKNVYAVYDTTGQFDAVILSRFKNTKSADKFLKQLQALEFVERTNTSIILNTIKQEQVLF